MTEKCDFRFAAVFSQTMTYAQALVGLSWLVGGAVSLTARAAVEPIHPAQPVNHPTRIEEALFVPLGGIEQWITIRGDDTRAPILILVHGGPGDVQSPFVSTYSPYERDFLLVQWDQRGAGKTYGKYGPKTPDLTLERVAKDGIELAEYLRRRFKPNGIIVLGHSWGTAIATEMVRSRPDLFAAYVGTGQIASWAESVNAQFAFLKLKAQETNNATMLADLEAIGHPDPFNAKQYFAFTRPLRKYLDESDTRWLSGLPELTRDSPGITDEGMKSLLEGMSFSGRTLLPTSMRENLSTEALRFDLPYFVIQGRDDMFTPTAAAKAYFDRVTAPKKRFAQIDDAGHFALATNSGSFIAVLKDMLQSTVSLR